jgi:tRNA modification GTPase
MVDSSQPITPADWQIYEMYRKRNIILVINKIDLLNNGTEFDLPVSWQTIPATRISALHDIGIDGLKKTIESLVWNDIAYDPETLIIPNIRHKIALEKSREAVSSAILGISEDRPFELIAIDIQEAMNRLGEIMGINVREDVMDQIFSRFCIGK